MKLLVLVWLVISDLSHLIVLLNSNFNCSNNLSSSSVDKVTTGTYSFVPVILNVASVRLLISATPGLASGQASLLVLSVITQFSDQVKIRFISQLISGISCILQKLLKYFNGTAIWSSFSILLPSNPLVMLVL